MNTSYKPNTRQEQEQIEELARILRVPTDEIARLLGEKMGAMRQKASDLGLRFKATNPADATAAALGLTQKATGAPGADITEAEVARLMTDPNFARLVEKNLRERAKRAGQGKRGAFESTVKDLGF